MRPRLAYSAPMRLVSGKESARPPQEPGITLVLGSGGARGLAHIGVLQALKEIRVPVRAVVGCSIGAQIGALYCAGMSPETLADTARRVNFSTVLKLFTPFPFGAGLVLDRGVRKFLQTGLHQKSIQDLDVPFVAVATDLQDGTEVVLDSGLAWSAVRASIAMPGILAPHAHEGRRHLADGALVNPLPVSVARSRYPWPVVAVQAQLSPRLRPEIGGRFRRPFGWFQVARLANETALWELGQARLRECPPDVLVEPAVREHGCFSYHRATDLIRVGYDAAMRHAQAIRKFALQKGTIQ